MPAFPAPFSTTSGHDSRPQRPMSATAQLGTEPGVLMLTLLTAVTRWWRWSVHSRETNRVRVWGRPMIAYTLAAPVSQPNGSVDRQPDDRSRGRFPGCGAEEVGVPEREHPAIASDEEQPGSERGAFGTDDGRHQPRCAERPDEGSITEVERTAVG